MPAAIAIAMFFSWIMLINGLRIPFYLFYERTVFLIYVGRFLDPTVWVLSSIFALVLVAAAGTRSRSGSFGLSMLFLSAGIAVATFVILGVGGQHVQVAGSLASFVGCALAGFGAIRDAASPSRRYFAPIFLLVLSLLILPAEVGSLLYYVLSAFQPGIQVGKSWELLELQLWYTAFPLIPFMYVAFLFSWIWAPFVTKILARSTRREGTSKAAAALSKPRRRVRVGRGKLTSGNASTKKARSWLLVIGVFLFLALFLGYYAYFQDPSYPLVGTDIYWRYSLPAKRVLSSDSWVAAAAGERHPLVVLGIAVASNFFGLGVESLLRFAYVWLILAFGGAVFLLVFVGSGSRMLASFSALIVTVSPLTTAEMYTGTIAEWLALIVWVLSLTLLAINKTNGLRGYVLSIVGLGFGSVIILFVHPWTWIAMMMGLISYALAAIIVRMKGVLRDIGSILVVIFINAVALTQSLLVLSKTQGWRVAEAFSLVEGSLRSEYLGFGSWEIVMFFSQIWSQFLHPVLLILSILGVIVLARRLDRFATIILAWLVAASVTSVVAAPMGYDPLLVARGESQIFRALFLTPFQIPAAAGLSFLKSTLDAKLSHMNRSRSVRVAIGITVGVLFLAMLNGAFRGLFPLLTDPHNYPNPLAP